MSPKKKSITQEQLRAENEALRTKVAELEQTLQSLQEGAVDAIAIPHAERDRIFTLQGADQVYRVLIEEMSDGALTLSPDGTVLYCNQRFAGMLSIPLNRIIGSKLATWLSPAEREKFEVLLRQAAERSQSTEITLPRMDGDPVVASVFANSLSLGGMQVIYLVVADLTEYKNREVMLRSALEEAREARSSLLSLLENQQSTEKQLRESESWLKQSQAASHLGHWVWNFITNHVTYSDELFRIYGLNPATFNGDPFEAINTAVHPDDRASMFEIGAAVVRGGHPAPAEYRVVWRDGSIRTIYTELVEKINDGKGNLIGAWGIAQDITERKQAEEKLRESEFELQRFLDNSPDTVYVLDLVEHTSRFLNREEFLGYSRAELESDHSIMAAVHPDDLVHLSAQWKQLPSLEPNQVLETQYRVKNKRGDWEWVQQRNTVLTFAEDGKPQKVLNTLSVITDRMQMERTLRESQKHLATIFNSSPLPIAVSQLKDGRYLEVNDAFARFTGYTIREIVGHTGVELGVWKDPDNRKQMYAELVDKGSLRDFEFQMRRKDGTQRDILLSAESIEVDGELCALTIAQDITQLKKAQAEVESVARFPAENPNPVLRLNQAGKILYANQSSEALLGEWQCGVGGFVPAFLQEQIAGVFVRKTNTVLEVPCGDLVYLTTITYLAQSEYVNLYLSDITERKRAEEALRESEERFRRLIEFSPVATIAFDEAGNFELVNHKAVELFGGSSEQDLLGHPVIERVHPDFRARTAQRIALAAATDGPVPFVETVFLRLDGKEVHVLSGGMPLTFRGKRSYVVSFLDITERLQAEEARRENEAKFAAAFYTSPVAMAITRRSDGLFLEFNDELERISGYSRAELLGHTSVELGMYPSPETRQKLSTQGEFLKLEMQLRNKSGEWRWLSFNVSQIQIQGQDCALAVIEDIHERKLMEQALRESEAKFVTAFRISPLALGIVGHDGRYVDVNEATSKLFGFSSEEMIGKTIAELEVMDEPTRQRVRSVIMSTGGKVEHLELELHRPDGTIRSAVYSINPILINGVPHHLGAALDITDRKQIERELRASEEKYRGLMESLENEVATVDQDGRFLYLNRVAAHQLGHPAETLVGKTMHELFPQAVADRQLEYVREAIYKDRSVAFENPSVVAGQLRWYKTTIHPVHDLNGRVIHALINSADIHELKMVQQELQELNRTLEERVDERTAKLAQVNTELLASQAALRQSEEFIRNINNNLGTGMVYQLLCLKDGSRKFTYLSDSVRWFYGITPKQGMADPALINDRIYAEDRQRILELEDASGRTLLDFKAEIRRMQPDGSLRWSSLASKPTRMDDGTICWNGVELDITEYKQAEADLRQSKERMELALRAAQDGVWDWNLETDEVFYSSRWKSMLGYEEDGIEPHVSAWKRLLHPDDLQRSMQVVEDVIHGEREFAMEFRMRHRDGHYVNILSRGIPIHRVSDGPVVRIVGTHFDLTERKQAEKALQAVNAELERAMRIKDEFLATMSHELRTPLNGILGMSEILAEQDFGPLNERQVKYARSIYDNGRHLLSLINDILDLSKVEAGMLELSFAPVSVMEICQSSISFVRELSHQKKIDLAYQITPPSLSAVVDDRRVKQILVNLLGNAVKFTPERGKIRLDVEADARNKVIDFIVSDTGVGISAADLARLFQPFTQVDSSLAREYGGTGLGLALVKKMTELHGGTIRVESEVGKGSRFIVSIPWKNVPETEPAKPLAANPKPQSTGMPATEVPGTRRILVAEDNLVTVEFITDYLVHLGYEVIHAENGSEVISKAKQYHPDLILMDIQMPHVDGLEAIKLLRQLPEFAQKPIFATTALAMVGDRERCLAAGATDYISKPYDLKTLKAKILSIFNDRSWSVAGEG